MMQVLSIIINDLFYAAIETIMVANQILKEVVPGHEITLEINSLGMNL